MKHSVIFEKYCRGSYPGEGEVAARADPSGFVLVDRGFSEKESVKGLLCCEISCVRLLPFDPFDLERLEICQSAHFGQYLTDLHRRCRYRIFVFIVLLDVYSWFPIEMNHFPLNHRRYFWEHKFTVHDRSNRIHTDLPLFSDSILIMIKTISRACSTFTRCVDLAFCAHLFLRAFREISQILSNICHYSSPPSDHRRSWFTGKPLFARVSIPDVIGFGGHHAELCANYFLS
jgi:hypothetical protein